MNNLRNKNTIDNNTLYQRFSLLTGNWFCFSLVFVHLTFLDTFCDRHFRSMLKLYTFYMVLLQNPKKNNNCSLVSTLVWDSLGGKNIQKLIEEDVKRMGVSWEFNVFDSKIEEPAIIAEQQKNNIVLIKIGENMMI